MPKKSRKLMTVKETEAAGVKLFDQIDRYVDNYIGLAENALLKEQAMRNVVGMLDILKAMYQYDLKLYSTRDPVMRQVV
jgi:hypothetical protein